MIEAVTRYGWFGVVQNKSIWVNWDDVLLYLLFVALGAFLRYSSMRVSWVVKRAMAWRWGTSTPLVVDEVAAKVHRTDSAVIHGLDSHSRVFYFLVSEHHNNLTRFLSRAKYLMLHIVIRCDDHTREFLRLYFRSEKPSRYKHTPTHANTHKSKSGIGGSVRWMKDIFTCVATDGCIVVVPESMVSS